jgi:hypothetical protein
MTRCVPREMRHTLLQIVLLAPLMALGGPQKGQVTPYSAKLY